MNDAHISVVWPPQAPWSRLCKMRVTGARMTSLSQTHKTRIHTDSRCWAALHIHSVRTFTQIGTIIVRTLWANRCVNTRHLRTVNCAKMCSNPPQCVVSFANMYKSMTTRKVAMSERDTSASPIQFNWAIIYTNSIHIVFIWYLLDVLYSL